LRSTTVEGSVGGEKLSRFAGLGVRPHKGKKCPHKKYELAVPTHLKKRLRVHLG